MGRESEMAILLAALDQVSGGQGAAVFVGGEPGIGKTSLGRHLATQAQTRGLHVLWGRCREDDVKPPYWPWIELLRPDVLELSKDPLVGRLLGSASSAAGPSTSGDLASAPHTDRLAVFHDFAARLLEAATARPLLLVFDDLHGADRSSLSLLQCVVQRIAGAPILVLGLYRDIDIDRQHPLAHFLAEAAREPFIRRLSLGGLRADDVASFLEIRSGTRPPAATVDAIFRQTAGNPFFVKELVRLLLADPRLAAGVAGGMHPPIPQSVREVIGRRLDGVSAGCNRVLALAAVLGGAFTVSVLERLAEVPREALLGFLEEAARGRLVIESAPGSGRYRFAHALIRDTLYSELPAAHRIKLHRHVGEALEALYGSCVEPHLAELAFHFTEAARGGDTAKAIAYSLWAGEHAAASTAFEDAIRYQESALETLDLAPERDARVRCEVLLLLSENLWRSGCFQRARATALEAFGIARALASVTHLARAALGVAGRMALFGAGSCEQRVVDVLEEALGAMGEDESTLRAMVSGRLAQELVFAAPPERPRELACGAVDQARRVGDPAVLALVLRNTWGALWASRTPGERLQLARELIGLAGQVGDRATALEGRVFAFLSHVELGDRAAAVAALDTCARAATHLRQPYGLWLVGIMRACWASSEGPLEEFERLAQEALALGRDAENQAADLFFGVQLAYLNLLRGRFDEEEHTILLRAGSFPLLMPPLRAALAMTYAMAGRLTEARAEFDRMATGGFAGVRQDVTWMLVTGLLARTCALLDDPAAAAVLYARLLPHAGRNVVQAPLLFAGSVDHYLGLLAAALRRWDDAERHFEAALEMDARMHAAAQLAIAQHEYARMLIARCRPEDGPRIAALLDEAHTTAERVGMATLAEKIGALAAAYPSAKHASDGVPGAGAGSLDRPTPLECIFRREGDYWTIVHRGTVARLKHRKGFEYLARLLRCPARELAAFDLVAGNGDDPLLHRHLWRDRPSGSGGTFGDCGPVLDHAARVEYRRRYAELQEQLAEAEQMNDLLQVSRLREETEVLTEQLARAVGIGGRGRRTGSAAERSRCTVTKGIRGAIRAIRDSNPALGRYLDIHVQTGHLCVYRPDPEQPLVFQ